MPSGDDNRRPVLNPNWLFATIVAILVSHLIFLYILLSLCFWGIRLNFLAILEREGVVTQQYMKQSRPNEELGLCRDLDDDFRNARNKAVEIILALLVPTSTIVGTNYIKDKRKEDDVQPPGSRN